MILCAPLYPATLMPRSRALIGLYSRPVMNNLTVLRIQNSQRIAERPKLEAKLRYKLLSGIGQTYIHRRKTLASKHIK